MGGVGVGVSAGVGVGTVVPVGVGVVIAVGDGGCDVGVVGDDTVVWSPAAEQTHAVTAA